MEVQEPISSEGVTPTSHTVLPLACFLDHYGLQIAPQQLRASFDGQETGSGRERCFPKSVVFELSPWLQSPPMSVPCTDAAFQESRPQELWSRT